MILSTNSTSSCVQMNDSALPFVCFYFDCDIFLVVSLHDFQATHVEYKQTQMLLIFITDSSFLIVPSTIEESLEISGYVSDTLGRIKTIRIRCV